MGQFIECFIPSVNCFTITFYWALPYSLVNGLPAMGNTLTLNTLPRLKASFQSEDKPNSAILIFILEMINVLELPCILGESLSL